MLRFCLPPPTAIEYKTQDWCASMVGNGLWGSGSQAMRLRLGIAQKEYAKRIVDLSRKGVERH